MHGRDRLLLWAESTAIVPAGRVERREGATIWKSAAASTPSVGGGLCMKTCGVLCGVVVGVAMSAGGSASAQTMVTLSPVKDNTLYQVSAGSTALSNGAGQHWFAGRTIQSSLRRGLMAFNVSSIPAEANILEVTLSVHCSRSAIAGLEDISMHRVLANWGEGSSNDSGNEGDGTAASTGDATWFNRIHPSTGWTQAGGQFVATPSLTKPIGNVDFYDLQSEGLAEDVRFWIANPGQNFGWIFRGNELAAGTAKRFDSRENPDPSVRPFLTVIYTLGPVCDSIDFNNDNSFFDPQDVEAFLSVFSEGPCVPVLATCNDIDFNNDGSVFDPQDIDAFLSVFSEGPCL
jgi:hypothetical protein